MRFIAHLLFTLLIPFPVLAQTAPNTPASGADGAVSTTQSPSGTAPAATYRMGADDEITLVVVGEEDFNRTYRVQSDGSIVLPWIGSVTARGLTTTELQERIREALAKSFIRDPQVRVEISKFGSQFVMVQGEVRMPGKVPMTGPLTLMQALAAAGSPTPNASSVISIARRPTDSNGLPTAGNAENITVNLNDLLRGVAGADIPLRGDDIVNVPKAETFYVQGRVKNVGVYVWEPGMTVAQAITKAGGLDDRGRDTGIKATRMVNGKLVDIDVRLTDLIQPNDTIIVPQRRF